MNILINLSTLKMGGGQNVGLNLLNEISMSIRDEHVFSFIVAEGSRLEKLLVSAQRWKYLTVSSNPVKRTFEELTKCRTFIREVKADIVYTCFGYGLYGHAVLQVCGLADSNLLYPELDFWVEYHGIKRLKKKIVDWYRLYGYRHANGLVFENESMLYRYQRQVNSKKSVVYIKPSITVSVVETKLELPENCKKLDQKALFFCGWQLNKNVLKIPEIVREIINSGYQIRAILTAPKDNSDIMKRFISLCYEYDVNENVVIMGTVLKEQISSLYAQVDYVFLLSRLESFSNNIIEAWYYQRPLIVSDLEWAHSICKEAAQYVDRDDCKSIAEGLISLAENDQLKNRIIENGKREISTYPNISERMNQELAFLKSLYENSR